MFANSWANCLIYVAFISMLLYIPCSTEGSYIKPHEANTEVYRVTLQKLSIFPIHKHLFQFKRYFPQIDSESPPPVSIWPYFFNKNKTETSNFTPITTSLLRIKILQSPKDEMIWWMWTSHLSNFCQRDGHEKQLSSLWQTHSSNHKTSWTASACQEQGLRLQQNSVKKKKKPQLSALGNMLLLILIRKNFTWIESHSFRV